MAQSKTSTAVDKTRKKCPGWEGGSAGWVTIAWSANVKETSDCLNLILAFFLAHFVSRRRDNKEQPFYHECSRSCRRVSTVKKPNILSV